MSNYGVQEWPDMPGDDGGDAIVFCSDWPGADWERRKSWEDAWSWLAGRVAAGDTVKVLRPMSGRRDDSYTP